MLLRLFIELGNYPAHASGNMSLNQNFSTSHSSAVCEYKYSYTKLSEQNMTELILCCNFHMGWGP